MKGFVGRKKIMPKRKKALLFIEDGSFSYDNRVRREAKALNDAGWDITVISPRYKKDPLYKKVNDNLRAYYYPKPDTESLPGHVIELIFSVFFGSVLTFWVFIRHGFSVFLACNPMDILWLIALPYKFIGKKFIFDQHDLVPELILSRSDINPRGLMIKIFYLFERISYRLANVVISTNESYKEVAISRGSKKPEAVFVVRNGPDLNKFQVVPPKQGLKKASEILVGYLGNMNPQDGVGYLLEAADIIVNKQSRESVKFVFVGGGSSQPKLADEAVRMGLEKNVLFTGRIPDDDMLATLCACDICVQPDPYNPLNDKSTMNKVMEYMALEKPVVTFDLKETRVSCGEAALYVTPNKSAEMAEKILFLADRPEIRSDMGKAGRERIEKKLSWSYSIPYLIAAFDRTGKRKNKN